jgi:hypothetical protein
MTRIDSFMAFRNVAEPSDEVLSQTPASASNVIAQDFGHGAANGGPNPESLVFHGGIDQYQDQAHDACVGRWGISGLVVGAAVGGIGGALAGTAIEPGVGTLGLMYAGAKDGMAIIGSAATAIGMIVCEDAPSKTSSGDDDGSANASTASKPSTDGTSAPQTSSTDDNRSSSQSGQAANGSASSGTSTSGSTGTSSRPAATSQSGASSTASAADSSSSSPAATTSSSSEEPSSSTDQRSSTSSSSDRSAGANENSQSSSSRTDSSVSTPRQTPQAQSSTPTSSPTQSPSGSGDDPDVGGMCGGPNDPNTPGGVSIDPNQGGVCGGNGSSGMADPESGSDEGAATTGGKGRPIAGGTSGMADPESGADEGAATTGGRGVAPAGPTAGDVGGGGAGSSNGGYGGLIGGGNSWASAMLNQAALAFLAQGTPAPDGNGHDPNEVGGGIVPLGQHFQGDQGFPNPDDPGAGANPWS